VSVTVEQCASYVGADPEIEPALSVLPILLDTAVDLIDRHMKGRTDRVSTNIANYAVMQLVSELWTRRNAPGGIAAFADGVPVRMARDALVSVTPLLNPSRPLGSVG
jgi:hypothetical protein